ncbi:MAG: hypothetical protein AB8G22_09630 [Saprospiraceae bacterium]
MNSIKKQYNYTVFGLQIRSSIPLTGFHHSVSTETFDVNINLGKIKPPKTDINDAIYLDGLIYHPTFCYLSLPDGGGQFFIKKQAEQTEVIIDFDDPAKKQTLLAYFYGTGLSAILQLNNQFAIHASGVIIDGELVLFCGESGVGKSTTAAYLKSKGYPLFTDDKCVLFSCKKQDQWFAHPSLQIVRLWNDAIEHLPQKDFLTDPVAVVYNQEKQQFKIKSTEVVKNTPPLRKIYILSKDTEQTKIESRSLQGIEKMRHLQEQIFRRFMVSGFQREKVLWAMISRLAMDIPVELIKRPSEGNISDFGIFIEDLLHQYSY